MDKNNLLSLSESCSENSLINEIVTIFKTSNNSILNNPNLLKPNKFIYNKTSLGFVDFGSAQPTVDRNPENDRIFPMETISINAYNLSQEAEVETVFIHTGMSADEYARSLNAMAVTIAHDIYFRNGAYHPETEEGRSILAHELTHVRQYEEKRLTTNVPKADFEREAEKAEQSEYYEADPLATISIKGRLYTFPKSQMNMIAKELAHNIQDWVESQKYVLDEEKYLELLLRYKNIIKRRRLAW